MFVQSEFTPNPNSIKFLPGKTVSKNGSFEVTKKDDTNNDLIKNLFSVSGVESIFLRRRRPGVVVATRWCTSTPPKRHRRDEH